MFSTNSSKICCSFAKNNIFEKSKKAAKMRTCCEIGCCHGNSSYLELDFCYGK